jgi:hypothetical protein
MFCQFIDLMAIHLENCSFMDITECLYSQIGNSIDEAAFFLSLCADLHLTKHRQFQFQSGSPVREEASPAPGSSKH